eukprot:COSAG01_NODE_2654_length_7306_cov_60.980991_5_plen_55_part_00
MALPQGRAPLGALTPAYSRTPPFPSWGRSEDFYKRRWRRLSNLLMGPFTDHAFG